MDTNTGLLIFSGIYGIFFFWRLWAGSRGADVSEWKLPTLLFFGVFGLALLLALDIAGYVGTIALLLLVIIPVQGTKLTSRLVFTQRYGLLRRLTLFLRLLHPVPYWREENQFYKALELAHSGHTDEAITLLDQIKSTGSAMATSADHYRFRLRWDWQGLRKHLEAQMAYDPDKRNDPYFAHIYARTLGEVGDLNGMWNVINQGWATLARSSYMSLTLLAAFAFSGRRDALDKLLSGVLSVIDEPTKNAWQVAALYAAGDQHQAESLVQSSLSANVRPMARMVLEQRLANPPIVAASVLSATAEQAVVRAAQVIGEYSRIATIQQKTPWVTFGLIAANVIVFMIELARNGSEDVQVLYQLGAFLPRAITVNGEWWRLLTSIFLHYGWMHLLFNMLGMNAIGPFVERVIGWWRYILLYFGAGLGAGVLMLVADQAGWMGAEFNNTISLGASGAIMGVLGAYFAIVLRSWLHTRNPLWWARLLNVGVVLVLQFVLDASGIMDTSAIAHFGGALIGFVIAMVFAAITPKSVLATNS
jgi:rhomboid protease GluP